MICFFLLQYPFCFFLLKCCPPIRETPSPYSLPPTLWVRSKFNMFPSAQLYSSLSYSFQLPTISWNWYSVCPTCAILWYKVTSVHSHVCAHTYTHLHTSSTKSVGCTRIDCLTSRAGTGLSPPGEWGDVALFHGIMEVRTVSLTGKWTRLQWNPKWQYFLIRTSSKYESYHGYKA